MKTMVRGQVQLDKQCGMEKDGMTIKGMEIINRKDGCYCKDASLTLVPGLASSPR